MFGRAYFCAIDINAGVGMTAEKVYVYDGTTVRNAAGVAPTGFTITAATSATAGKVEAGQRLIAVAYETSSGFITQPGPAAFTLYTGPGAKQLSISTLPAVPGTGVTYLHLLSTRKINAYSGRQKDYELFFTGTKVAAGITVATLDFYDNDLVSSAAYLLDLKVSLPAGVKLLNYNGRLVILGDPLFPHTAWISRAGDPESISSVNGYCIVNPGDGADGCRNGADFRGNLYIHKPRRTYVTSDNGREPSTWQVVLVDAGVGCEWLGVSQLIEGEGNTLDSYIVTDRRGLLLFNGSFEGVELTYNIKSLWDAISAEAFKYIHVNVDPARKLIYLLYSDLSVNVHGLLVGDYADGISKDTIKWDFWHFSDLVASPITAMIYDDPVSDKTAMLFGGYHNIYQMDDAATSDDGKIIRSYYATGFVRPSSDGLYSFNAVRIRAHGTDSLYPAVKGTDFMSTGYSVYPAPVPLFAQGDGKEYLRKFNLVSEMCNIEFQNIIPDPPPPYSTPSVGQKYKIRRLVVYFEPYGEDRPQ